MHFLAFKIEAQAALLVPYIFQYLTSTYSTTYTTIQYSTLATHHYGVQLHFTTSECSMSWATAHIGLETSSPLNGPQRRQIIVSVIARPLFASLLLSRSPGAAWQARQCKKHSRNLRPRTVGLCCPTCHITLVEGCVCMYVCVCYFSIEPFFLALNFSL